MVTEEVNIRSRGTGECVCNYDTLLCAICVLVQMYWLVMLQIFYYLLNHVNTMISFFVIKDSHPNHAVFWLNVS